jgi:alkylation response protein AidB-like acyl-CoA dehydrogenase
MEFEFDEDQRFLRDTVREVLAKACPLTLVRAISDDGADPEPLWREYVDLGWTELTEQDQMVELAIVLEELGRATDPTPYLATMTQFGPLLPEVAKPGQSGTAVYEGVTARRDGDAWVLDGTAKHVLDGDRADWFAVVTKDGVFPVRATEVAGGVVTAKRAAVFDPVLHLAEVSFAQVRVPDSDRGTVDPDRARHIALTGLAATMVGACARGLELTLEHVRTRRQFDVPIGSFQAVKHKLADLHVAIERARALTYFAALTIAEDDPRRRLAASMAKAAAGECAARAFRDGVQLHGAMGFTWENDVQFALKRAKAGDLLLGEAAEHRQLIAEESHAVDL